MGDCWEYIGEDFQSTNVAKLMQRKFGSFFAFCVINLKTKFVLFEGWWIVHMKDNQRQFKCNLVSRCVIWQRCGAADKFC